jgi:hypothetical protein
MAMNIMATARMAYDMVSATLVLLSVPSRAGKDDETHVRTVLQSATASMSLLVDLKVGWVHLACASCMCMCLHGLERYAMQTHANSCKLMQTHALFLFPMQVLKLDSVEAGLSILSITEKYDSVITAEHTSHVKTLLLQPLATVVNATFQSESKKLSEEFARCVPGALADNFMSALSMVGIVRDLDHVYSIATGVARGGVLSGDDEDRLYESSCAVILADVTARFATVAAM